MPSMTGWPICDTGRPTPAGSALECGILPQPRSAASGLARPIATASSSALFYTESPRRGRAWRARSPRRAAGCGACAVGLHGDLAAGKRRGSPRFACAYLQPLRLASRPACRAIHPARFAATQKTRPAALRAAPVKRHVMDARCRPCRSPLSLRRPPVYGPMS